MKYDLEFAERIKCSEDEKRQCIKLVSDLISLANKARNYGMLSLVIDAEETTSFLMRKGIQMATDGAKPQVVRSILEFYIISGNFKGKDLLERCIILEGLVAIQEGLHPKLLKELLLSFFGEKDHQILNEDLEDKSKKSIKTFLNKIQNTQATSPKGEKLSAFILKLSDDAVKELLKEVNTLDLAKAVKEMSGRAIIKILNNMWQKGAVMLTEALEQMDSVSKEELAKAQDQFIKTLSDLKKRG